MIPVDEGRIVEVRADGATFSDFDGNPAHPEAIEVDWDAAQAEKGGFDTFMLKEIHEQPAAIRDTLVGRVDEFRRLALDDLRIPDDVLREVDKVFVVACGTAYHSGLVAKYAIEHWTRLPVEIDIASEFRYRDPVLGPDTLTLAVSQSGETIDTLEAARHARRQGSPLLAVTNTVGSSLAREADGVIYMHAGPGDRCRGHQDVRDPDGVAVRPRDVPRAGPRLDVPRGGRGGPDEDGGAAGAGRARDPARRAGAGAGGAVPATRGTGSSSGGTPASRPPSKGR